MRLLRTLPILITMTLLVAVAVPGMLLTTTAMDTIPLCGNEWTGDLCNIPGTGLGETYGATPILQSGLVIELNVYGIEYPEVEFDCPFQIRGENGVGYDPGGGWNPGGGLYIKLEYLLEDEEEWVLLFYKSWTWDSQWQLMIGADSVNEGAVAQCQNFQYAPWPYYLHEQ